MKTKNEFIRLLQQLATLPVRHVSCGDASEPPPRDCNVELYPRMVIDIPLSGIKSLQAACGGTIREYRLLPGDAHISPAKIWKCPGWRSAHELCCIVLDPAYLRVTYVHADGSGKKPVCSDFFHTAAPPPDGLRQTANVLAALVLKQPDHLSAAELYSSLLHWSAAALLMDSAQKPQGKAERSFQLIRQYLAENFSGPVSRENTAAHFQMNPDYLSRLFREKTGCSFSRNLLEIRMEHAEYLLKNSDFLVDEIARQCGFQSTPAFTTAFRRLKGLPPGDFRRTGGICSPLTFEIGGQTHTKTDTSLNVAPIQRNQCEKKGY